MKTTIAAFLFIVSWQEFALKLNMGISSDRFSHTGENDYYTIETVDHSIKLKTRKDVNLFIGKGDGVSNGWRVTNGKGLISDKAFNIQAKEEK